MLRLIFVFIFQSGRRPILPHEEPELLRIQQSFASQWGEVGWWWGGRGRAGGGGAAAKGQKSIRWGRHRWVEHDRHPGTGTSSTPFHPLLPLRPLHPSLPFVSGMKGQFSYMWRSESNQRRWWSWNGAGGRCAGRLWNQTDGGSCEDWALTARYYSTVQWLICSAGPGGQVP